MARRKKKGAPRNLPARQGPGDVSQAPPVAVAQRSSLYAITAHRGPLPPPEMLQQYGEIIPGGAERLVAWVESETAHRQAMEKLLVEGGLDIEKRGQMFALLITLGTIGAGTALIVSGFGIGGLALIVGELAILAGVFIYGRVTEGRSQAGTDDSRRGSSPPRD